ncbi:MAG: Coenzyme F420 hydrogenase/dehydrogenase, beta subunit C-terminal domain [Chloroflexota bacterium]
MEEKLRREAKALLAGGKVARLIGYAPGSLKFTTTPLITGETDEADLLVISPFIDNNLSVYLGRGQGRTAIVAKGCDSRAIVNLIQEKQVNREDLFIFGVPCTGIIDVRRVESLTGMERDDIDAITREGDKVTVTIDGKAQTFPAGDVLREDCLGCESPVPREYDVLLGEAAPAVQDADAGRKRLKELEILPPAERWQFWQDEFRRCIRCYACRQVCPACFCERCFIEESEPRWLSPVPHWPDNLLFQLTRVLHTAGRCTDCGECERACPADIPLRALTRSMADAVTELFDYHPGTDITKPPLMTAYQSEETGDLFR